MLESLFSTTICHTYFTNTVCETVFHKAIVVMPESFLLLRAQSNWQTWVIQYMGCNSTSKCIFCYLENLKSFTKYYISYFELECARQMLSKGSSKTFIKRPHILSAHLLLLILAAANILTFDALHRPQSFTLGSSDASVWEFCRKALDTYACAIRKCGQPLTS